MPRRVRQRRHERVLCHVDASLPRRTRERVIGSAAEDVLDRRERGDGEAGARRWLLEERDVDLAAFERRRDRARERMVEMISGIVTQRRDSGRKGEDFLQTLMDAKYKHGAPLTEDEITGMLLASMFAGHHTSSVTTAWTLIELLSNPVHLDRVVDELDARFELRTTDVRPLVSTVTHGEIRVLAQRNGWGARK